MSLPTHGPYPSVGLYWFIDADPTIGPGLAAPLGQLAVRTDDNTIYYKSGPLVTNWILLGTGGGGGIGVNVQDEGLAIPGNPHQTLNFTGEGVVASDAGGSVANIAISGTGASLVNIPLETFINLVGTHDDVNLWGAGPLTSRVEVDLVGGPGATITGIDATGFIDGDVLLLWNGGGGTVPEDTLTLVNQSAASLPNNRIWIANGKSLNIPNNDGVLLVYIGNSWTVFGGATTMVRAQELSLDPSATPATLANGSTTHNYDPFAAGGKVTSYVKQDTGLTSAITGIVAAGAPNSDGRILVFQNISATGTITIKNNDPGSIADNRILCPYGQDVKLGPRSSAILIYDVTVGMWRVAASPGANNVAPLTNGEVAAVPIGTPVYCSAADTFKLAKADVPNTAILVGLVNDVSVTPGAVGNVQLDDVLTATAAQWDAVTGDAGGLQFGTRYYVSPTTAGKLTSVLPSTIGQFVTKVGSALSPTKMLIRPEGPDIAVNTQFMFALWGQSNAFGQEGTGNIVNDQRINIGEPFANVNFRQKSSQPPAGDPIVWTTDSTGILSSYTSTQNNNSGHGIDGTGLGPAQSLGRHLDYYQPSKNGITCVGVSGTSLATHWDPTGNYPAGGPNLYEQAVVITNAARATFGAAITGFFWVQGETDAVSPVDAGNYQANLTNLFATVRAAYGPNLPIVFPQLSVHSSAPHAATVRAAQAAVAAATPNCTMVVTDDVPLGGDGTHYTADGYAALGDRMAAEMVALLGWAAPVTAWTIDRFSLVGIPQNAAEWNAVMAAAGLPGHAPSRLYLLQEAAGAIADTISGINMAPTGAGMTYRTPVPNGDWEIKSIAFGNGMPDAFVTTSAALPDPTTTSFTRLMYAWVPQVAGPENMYIIGTAGFEAIANSAGGAGSNWQLSDGGNTVVGADNVYSFNARPFVHLRSLTGFGAPRVDAYTSNAHIHGVIGPVTGKSESIGCVFGAVQHQAIMCVEWDGAAADFITTDIKSILELLNWGNADLGAAPIPW